MFLYWCRLPISVHYSTFSFKMALTSPFFYMVGIMKCKCLISKMIVKFRKKLSYIGKFSHFEGKFLLCLPYIHPWFWQTQVLQFRRYWNLTHFLICKDTIQHLCLFGSMWSMCLPDHCIWGVVGSLISLFRPDCPYI